MENLLFWNKQVSGYLNLKHLSVGLTAEERRLLNGLRGTIDKSAQDVWASNLGLLSTPLIQLGFLGQQAKDVDLWLLIKV